MIKFYTFILGAFLLISVNVNAQKKHPALLEFFNGDIKKGLIEMPEPDSKKIKFQASLDDEQIKIKTEEVSAITIKKDSSVMRIENISISGTKYSMLMAKLVEGKVNLYGYGHLGQLAGLVTYYVKRANEEKATPYNSLSFRKKMSKYFEDDPEIVKYIQETKLLELDLVGIVRTYNSR